MNNSRPLERQQVPLIEQDIVLFSEDSTTLKYAEAAEIDMVAPRKKGSRKENTTPLILVTSVPVSLTPHHLMAQQGEKRILRSQVEGICCPKCWVKGRYTAVLSIKKLLAGFTTEFGTMYRYCTSCDYQKKVG